jgi:hypothetical protein
MTSSSPSFGKRTALAAFEAAVSNYEMRFESLAEVAKETYQREDIRWPFLEQGCEILIIKPKMLKLNFDYILPE